MTPHDLITNGANLLILGISILFLLAFGTRSRALANGMEWIRVSDDKQGFVFRDSGKKFVPWGFNYDHDERGRLLEDYWDAEWPKVEEDFHEMKQLGANVVRIHPQLGKFMQKPDEPNQHSLSQFSRLVALAEELNIYLDITGLGCYEKKDVPDWYDDLTEEARWEVQARFWEAVAEQCAGSPAIFCYDLMNEPVVHGSASEKRKDWLGPPFAGKCYVQFISLDPAGRPRTVIARQWCQRLVKAIRKYDSNHLITVGLVPWSLNRPGLTSGFVPEEIRDELDFISVHIYPEGSKLQEAMETLEGFSVGKPVIIEEMFPLKCSMSELAKFVDMSKKVAVGWIGFYWGKTPQEYRQSDQLQDKLILSWLDFFESRYKRK